MRINLAGCMVPWNKTKKDEVYLSTNSDVKWKVRYRIRIPLAEKMEAVIDAIGATAANTQNFFWKPLPSLPCQI